MLALQLILYCNDQSYLGDAYCEAMAAVTMVSAHRLHQMHPNPKAARFNNVEIPWSIPNVLDKALSSGSFAFLGSSGRNFPTSCPVPSRFSTACRWYMTRVVSGSKYKRLINTDAKIASRGATVDVVLFVVVVVAATPRLVPMAITTAIAEN
mmetsp:Transcript_1336/g.2344  ORF Transcript_1336/g.2344 Transcript_1336/m.2344 type:complete len:152 (-) Transcript_1336:209-664(-)